MSKDLTGYELSRQIFDFAFDNPEKIRPTHMAIYFFAIEHCNRLGWKKKFGFPTQMAMEAIGVKNWRTYNSALTDLVNWGFIDLIEKSKNQYSSCVISLCKKYKGTAEATTKSLDKALLKHGQKQSNITVGINKQLNNEQENKEQGNVANEFDDEPTETELQAKMIAQYLLDSICLWDDTHRYKNNPPSLSGWITDIDRAIRLDGRTPQQLKYIIDVLFRDNNKIGSFWAPNVQSGKKLRDQFDTIKNQIKEKHGKSFSQKQNEAEQFIAEYRQANS